MDALLPPDTDPGLRRCLCGRPVPKGRLVAGWGSGCARKHGHTPPPQPRRPATPRLRPTADLDDNQPTLFDQPAQEGELLDC